jgi:alkyldihydroxyacetonephosphate synthase
MCPVSGSAPHWIETPPPPGSFRAIFKWGDPHTFKHPNAGLIRLLQERLGVRLKTDPSPQWLGLEPVPELPPPSFAEHHLRALADMVGAENLRCDTFSRVRASYGAGMVDQLRLRLGILENLPAAVLAPRTAEDVQAVVAYCHSHRIPLYVYGGGSTVTRGREAVQGGITLDLSRHLNRILDFNETDQTVTAEAGIRGPDLEKALNEAPQRFGAKRRYTCGHFPQSFEYSSLGGWVVTRSAGQNSTYYGKIEDLVLAQDYATPVGRLKTPPYPRAAIGPDLDQIMIGSEGAYGVLLNATLRVFRYQPENTRRFAFFFKSWEQGQAAMREILQSEAGAPSIFRLSDGDETEVAMHMYGLAGTPVDGFLTRLGYRPWERCLLIGSCDGERGFTANLQRHIRAVCGDHGGLNLSLLPITQRWERERFRDPYLREDLLDFGVIIDTLECAGTWGQLPVIYQEVRTTARNCGVPLVMTHISHVYPQGANLYFIFILPFTSISDYLDVQYALIEAIRTSGAAVSHHHGVGKQTAPWLMEQLDATSRGVLQVLKDYFDPHHILNPGGTLGLDMIPEQAEKRWGKV